MTGSLRPCLPSMVVKSCSDEKVPDQLKAWAAFISCQPTLTLLKFLGKYRKLGVSEIYIATIETTFLIVARPFTFGCLHANQDCTCEKIHPLKAMENCWAFSGNSLPWLVKRETVQLCGKEGAGGEEGGIGWVQCSGWNSGQERRSLSHPRNTPSPDP